MKITDEMLNGFLDNELSPEEMEQVRRQLENDDALVMKIADLSQVDDWVAQHAKQIDHTEVPAKLTQLARQLDEKPTLQANNVVSMSGWKKFSNRFAAPTSIAASVAVLFALGTWTFNFNQEGIGREVATILDTAISGQSISVDGNTQVTPQLSFTSNNGSLCRQFVQQSSEVSITKIACKNDNVWQVQAQASEVLERQQSIYRTASNSQNLEQELDSMISGVPLDRQQERLAIERKWQAKNQ